MFLWVLGNCIEFGDRRVREIVISFLFLERCVGVVFKAGFVLFEIRLVCFCFLVFIV